MKKNWLLFAGLFSCAVASAQDIKPYGALPTKPQVAWADLEYYMFIHFGPNTFTNKEWGHGDEDPKVFNPKHLDARQWARTAKLAGMKGIVITAKHHDGFCLWPSKYSTHTVRESAWKDGKGDILKELSAACKEYGLKFGVYLSPWDRNHPAYGTAEYNQIFAKTLNEVLSGYGPVFEQWFDGANGGNIKQPYDWDLFHSVVYKNQPNAVIFSDVGPGCRWVGNENGYAGTTNWSTLNVKGFTPGVGGPDTKSLNEGNEDGEKWVPTECDVSIRPGWFYSPDTDDKVKSLNQLLDIYYASVGRNGNLILNVPVDRDGLIHPNDSTRLMELRQVLDASFKDNLARQAKVTATNTRSNNTAVKVSNLTDGNNKTYWAASEGKNDAVITLTYSKPVTFNRLVLQEFIALGQRVKAFKVEVLDNGSLKEVANETTIGHKRILRLPLTTTSQIRISILDAKAAPVISEIQLFKAPGVITTPEISRQEGGKVIINGASSPDVTIHYTTDGTEPDFQSPVYNWNSNISLPRGGTVKARAYVDQGKTAGKVVTKDFDIASGTWKVVGSTNRKAIDGNVESVYVTDKNEIQIDLAETFNLKGFTYTPPESDDHGGTISIYGYEFYVSKDGEQWSKVATGQFANIKNNPVIQTVKFQATDARYIKLVSTAPSDGKSKSVAIAELGILTR
ncbi:alpha-L-fucosidase [Chitinophaga silvatica]|uniref:alpha-L-fucosidase n=1 Tax=Chitinophaga silvatica TaxID=2282649 RepID=A0A3E1YEX0_9BACT|nr:alpha-L-fucosidase [Chitinophaga silvatica]RFS24847.1 alpha-L-fucosidase [Chitinophaga silvatica]